MNITFQLTRNDISPKLAKLAATAKNPSAVLRAMGTTFKSITEGNFNSVGAALRPTAWPAKWGGNPSNLKKSGLLWHSFHLTVTGQTANLSNPTPYAAIHQFGGVIRAKGKALAFPGAGGNLVLAKQVTIPARPFFPVKDGQLTPAAEAKIAQAGARALAQAAP